MHYSKELDSKFNKGQFSQVSVIAHYGFCNQKCVNTEAMCNVSLSELSRAAQNDSAMQDNLKYVLSNLV